MDYGLSPSKPVARGLSLARSMPYGLSSPKPATDGLSLAKLVAIRLKPPVSIWIMLT